MEVQFKNLAFIFYKGYCSGIAIHGFNRTEEELISVFRNNRKGVRAGEFKHTYFDIGFFSKHTFSYNRTEGNYFEKYRTYFLTGHFYTSILLPKNNEFNKMSQHIDILLIINLKSIENKMNQIKNEFNDLYPLSKSKDDFISMYINRYRAIFESILKFIIAIRIEKRQDEQIDISTGMIGQLTAIIKEKKLISSKLIKTIESITKQYLNPHSHDKSKKIEHHPELIYKVHNKI